MIKYCYICLLRNNWGKTWVNRPQSLYISFILLFMIIYYLLNFSYKLLRPFENTIVCLECIYWAAVLYWQTIFLCNIQTPKPSKIFEEANYSFSIERIWRNWGPLCWSYLPKVAWVVWNRAVEEFYDWTTSTRPSFLLVSNGSE